MKLLRSIPVRRAVALFLCGITLFYLTACNYYKVVEYGPNDISKIESIQSQKKILLHNGQDLYQVKTLIQKEGARVSMDLALAVPEQKMVIKPPRSSSNPSAKPDTVLVYEHPANYLSRKSYRYRPSEEGALVREVHIYLSQFRSDLKPGSIELSAQSIKEIHVIERDKGKSTTTTILAVAGGAAGALGLLLVIVALTKSSCPYAYVFDGQQYTFQGEIYSGAVLQNLERHDYLPLPLLKPHKGEYRLRIANELKERQYVNMAELIGVQHPQGTKVVLDAQGVPQRIAHPQLPLAAFSANGVDQREPLNQVDQQAFFFDEKDAPRNSLSLTFPKPEGAKQAKLVLNAKNSLWFDQLYGRFAEKIGTGYEPWMTRLGSMTREARQQQQIDQDFPLSVYLKTGTGEWRVAGRIPLAGPLGWRDMVLPLDLSQASGEKVELRLETGFLFWEIDYAALDFSDNSDMELIPLQPKSAKDQDGKSQLAALRADDDLYLRQPQPGLHTELHFSIPSVPPRQQMSWFLHSKGYYEHIRDFQNIPNLTELGQFRQPHYFDLFSKAEYQRLMATTWKESGGDK